MIRSNGADTYISILWCNRGVRTEAYDLACGAGRVLAVPATRPYEAARWPGLQARPRRTTSQYTPSGAQRRHCMILHDVRVHPSKANLKREDQLAWKIAGVAADRVAVDREATAMIINRI